MEGGLYICMSSESNGPNLLNETFERLHSDPCRPPLEGGLETHNLGRKGKSRLMCKDVQPLQSVKSGILAVPTDTGGPEN